MPAAGATQALRLFCNPLYEMLGRLSATMIRYMCKKKKKKLARLGCSPSMARKQGK